MTPALCSNCVECAFRKAKSGSHCCEPLQYWCRLQDLNPPPPDYKSGALPDELNRRRLALYTEILIGRKCVSVFLRILSQPVTKCAFRVVRRRWVRGYKYLYFLNRLWLMLRVPCPPIRRISFCAARGWRRAQ